MLFMGMFMLLVLPLFLLVCARILGESSYKDRGAVRFLQFLFYSLTTLSLLGSFMVFVELLRS